MNSERSQHTPNTSSIDECLDQVRFARAAELARTGCYLEAEALLSPKGRVPDSPRELDLLARIAVHQERFEDATRFWNTALKSDPDNAGYQESLKRLDRIRSGDQPSSISRQMLVWCGTVATVILMLIVFLVAARPNSTTHQDNPPITNTTKASAATESMPQTEPASAKAGMLTTPPTQITESLVVTATESASTLKRLEQTIQQMQIDQREKTESLTTQLAAIQATNSLLVADVNATRIQLATLSGSVEDLSSRQTAIQRAIDSTRSELAGSLAAYASATHANTNPRSSPPNLSRFDPGIAGVTVVPNENGCLISFDQGLFDRDQHFKIGAKARLQSLAKALVQTQTTMRVTVIGLAEDEPLTWPWSSARTSEDLGLRRAQSAAAYLLGLGIIPPDKLTAISGTPAQRLHPVPDRSNRTVLLQVSSN